jgi:hypothetical protein
MVRAGAELVRETSPARTMTITLLLRGLKTLVPSRKAWDLVFDMGFCG